MQSQFFIYDIHEFLGDELTGIKLDQKCTQSNDKLFFPYTLPILSYYVFIFCPLSISPFFPLLSPSSPIFSVLYLFLHLFPTSLSLLLTFSIYLSYPLSRLCPSPTVCLSLACITFRHARETHVTDAFSVCVCVRYCLDRPGHACAVEKQKHCRRI